MRALHNTTADELDIFHGKCDGHCDHIVQSRKVARVRKVVKASSHRRDRRDFRQDRNGVKFLINA